MVPVSINFPFIYDAVNLQPLADMLSKMVNGRLLWMILAELQIIVVLCALGIIGLLVALGLKNLFGILAEALESTWLSFLGLALEMVIPPAVAITLITATLWLAYGVVSLAFGVIAGAIVVIVPVIIIVLVLMKLCE